MGLRVFHQPSYFQPQPAPLPLKMPSQLFMGSEPQISLLLPFSHLRHYQREEIRNTSQLLLFHPRAAFSPTSHPSRGMDTFGWVHTAEHPAAVRSKGLVAYTPTSIELKSRVLGEKDKKTNES